MKIFLIGMPGSGKSTVGKQLAIKLNIPFIDLDVEIEKREGKSIHEIFTSNGEDYFRRIESQVLRETATLQNDFVVATGGGAPCFYAGIEIINKSGTSIFLDIAVEDLVKRVENDGRRPMLSSNDRNELRTKLTKLYTTRLSIYSQANIVVTASDLQTVTQALGIKN